MNRITPLGAAICAVLATAMPAHAAVLDSADAGMREFDRVQVTATRTERAIVDVPASVDVIDRERLDDTLARDIKDLVRYEPGISVTSSFGRFGLGGFRIRGLDGNRVQIQTDGIAVSDAFSIGSFANANRNFVDLDTLKRVEIVRGPASSLYGSDALGGVVAFVTKDPADYLAADKDAYFGLKFGYEGDWRGLFGGATAAFGGERWSGMVALSHRQGQETRNQGDDRSAGATRTAPNPQDRDGNSVLAKLVFAPSADQRFKLTAESNEDRTESDVLSAINATTRSLQGDDRQQRRRVSLGHELDSLAAGLADSLDWKVYWQDSRTTQDTDELRTGNIRRQRRFEFDQHVYGLQAIFHKALSGGSVSHDFTYGLDAARTRTEQLRNGVQTNLNTGVSSSTILPDVFPVRDFPLSDTAEVGLFVQDEMRLADGRLSLVPGLRVDVYRLEPEIDPIFAGDNPGVPVSDLDDTAVSPKFGAIWRFDECWSMFGNYAHGFRAPPYNDVNLGFTNFQFGYTAIPNPDLKPETSDGVELGLRFVGKAAYFGLSGYYNDYRDFIESFVNVGFNEQGLMVFQSRNVADARIYGAELKAGVDFGALSDGWSGWSLRGAAAWARGDNKTDDVPLDSVDPLRASLGLAYDGGAWGAELAGSFAGRKERVSDPVYYRPSGYGALDLMVNWKFAPGARIDFGVFNLGDRKYTDWADVPIGVAASAATLDRYTRPGRSVSASLAVSW
ncbi:TonB-dependent hemoglobin/transferrin/lactoferrin family receptor [Pseudoxanthomonas suwonensis]|uniref:Sugar transporter n=1 Tax=Pseudoxanthomonas suwonensis TaxID=314722 RepID=A0A0E3YZV5_9GAMM|nr:TonB-dependent hemoglobin/transferrin/lactoferrin family receptor [Pseudoxanthomonas suwonensis]AKC86157.1 sugar transporter [Pseudoxanthomonas suwonensis]